VAGLAEQADGLQPPEHFLDALAEPLTWSFEMSKETTKSSSYSTFARTSPLTIWQNKHSDTRHLLT